MWDPQLRTPGIVRSSIQAAVEIRTSSEWEVPGAVTQCMRKSRSLNSGSNDWPSWVIEGRRQPRREGRARSHDAPTAPAVGVLEATGERRLATLDRRVPQEDQGEGRRDGQGHQQRRQDRQPVGDGEGLEERP
jgi:hypothetical protein